MRMAFRSHVTRRFSLKYPAHRLIFLIGVVAGVLAIVDLLNDPRSEPGVITFFQGGESPLLAPVFVGVVWAFTREIDPDHNWTAVVAGTFSGWWVLTEGSAPPLIAVVVLLAAARVMTETTGRRPLLTDLMVLSALGVGAGYTAEGWVAGMGIAAAMFLDDRRAKRRLPAQPWIALATAIGVTIVAWLTDTHVSRDVSVPLGVAAAIGAILLIIRRPAVPTSLVDARRNTPLEQGRLHMSRAITGIVVYAMTVIAGFGDAEETVPILAVLALVIASNEIERISRRG